jgi:redox-sensitive bicupin YhaK (pirin superfamily)
MRVRGGALHGIQAWVALPDHAEELVPAFEHCEGAALPVVEGNGWRARIIAGALLDAASRVHTHSPLAYAHVELQAGASLQVPRFAPERALFVARGSVDVAGTTVRAGEMVVLASDATPAAAARVDATLMLLGGEPVGPRYIWWNFVSSRRERIEQAQADWKAGRIALPVGDADDFIPLPDDPLPEPHPLS